MCLKPLCLWQEKSVAVKAAEAVAAAVAAAMPASPVTVPETAPVAAAFVGASVAWWQLSGTMLGSPVEQEVEGIEMGKVW